MAEFITEWMPDSHKYMEAIVRCRDCRHYHAEINGCDEFGDIWHDEYANVEPDGFCAWAERKEEDA